MGGDSKGASQCQPPNLLFLPQMELKAGKGAERDRTRETDWKAALQREREEQQHLLAESYSARSWS